ncbi:hypothetical protein PRIPAC_76785 [Pristionchus pacificus]|uniref:ADP ribosylation factor n=1 Tax=Pristionchus pacificus TaxID=54126 RepID=A0A2A6CPR4_PRIPA|nr:hypothetical protein PRIPAC_76785 [Pristionchus pacificus]|eukprot:PDM80031.1 ADP ribosylation factor [Pristionchus pacificus]
MGQTICTPRNRIYGGVISAEDTDIANKTSGTISVTIATVQEQVAISKSIDNLLKMEKTEDKSRVKILLLGGADAGKSTIVKQMRILHMNGFSDDEKRSFYKYLRYNVFQIFHEISLGIQETILSVDDDEKSIVNRFGEGDSYFLSIDEEKEVDILLNFIALKCVRSFMHLYPNYPSLPDNAHYYMPKLADILRPKHTPTAQDILHLRIPTTSVSEINFTFETSSIRLIDVGGQRTYRKKWIHCFDGVAAVMFVASMAAYDQKLDESEVAIEPVLHDAIPAAAAATTIKHLPNRLRDSAHLFGEMLRSKFLLSSAFILFLNKKDLLSKKLISQPLGKYIKGYDGKTTEDASDFIRQYFLKRKSKKDKDRAIYGHYTCATDTKNVEFVFNAACDIVFKKNISKSGMQ